MATVVLFMGKECKPELGGVSGTCNTWQEQCQWCQEGRAGSEQDST